MRNVYVIVLAVFAFSCVGHDHRCYVLDNYEFTEPESQPQLIYPSKVDKDGTFLSHALKVIGSNDAGQNIRKRIRRDVKDDLLHYHVTIEGQNYLVELSANHHFIGPSLVVEKRSPKLNSGFKAQTEPELFNIHEHCYYSGRIINDTKSNVALANCNGLKGLIKTAKGEYFIEPLKGHEPRDDNTPHPHLVYKRQIRDPDTLHPIVKDTCGNTDEDFREISRKNLVTSKSKRRKRSVSVERNVETLVVADKMMLDYYSDEDIRTYILTIMNMVSSLYHDASIGNAINVVLVRIMLLDEEHNDLEITQHADQTLKSFCQWQKSINPSDENHPNHHDVAILLTRYNICTKLNEPCSTLGLAEVAGMCQPSRSCNVNEDTGLTLAYTIAHEMGHNFGMSHDGPQNGCEAHEGRRQHVMSPHLNSDTSPLVWSNCSRTEITKFLDRDWGSCLDDQPSEHDFAFPKLPPGAMYDVNHQCRLQYGPNAEFCDAIEDVCQTLWCRLDNKCVTRVEPAAEGTLCEKNKWCYMGQCTTIRDRPEAINGEWGGWSNWSPCSRPCGAGVSFSQRHCDNPPPGNGGQYCIGERKRYRVCNTDECLENAQSFRAIQCSRYNDIPYKTELYKWVPVSTPHTPCQLHCKPEGRRFSVMLSDTVEDGTPCNPGTRDMCINGKCRRVACDWTIDSNAQEDRCGICHGDGTHCRTIKGNFTEKHGLGYVEVVKVPKSARNIHVNEVENASNYIAVRNSVGEFILNGEWFIEWSGEYQVAGTTLYYDREGEKESLHAPGPIHEDLQILLLYQSTNPGLTYEYTIPYENATRIPEFHWEYSDWTVCSATCGGGLQVSKSKCMEKEAGHVEDKYCNQATKPKDKTRTCNKHLCPAKWWSGPWQHCSASCGKSGVRKRTVICVRSLGPDEQLALMDGDCEGLERPDDIEPCHHKHLCPGEAEWSTEEWTPCTRSCGGGQQERNVSCKAGQSCHHPSRPVAVRACNLHPCPRKKSELDNGHVIDAEDDSKFKKNPKHRHHDGELGKPNRKRTKNLRQANKERPSGSVRDVVHTVALQIPLMETQSNPPTADWIPDISGENVDPDGMSVEKEPPVVAAEGERHGTKQREKYEWRMSDWTNCSKVCGGGVRSRDALCIHTLTKRQVTTQLCDPFRMKPKEEFCNTQPCLEWRTSDWSECAVPCGEGQIKRKVWCPEPNKCSVNQKPKTTSSCFSGPCLKWIAGSWSPCSVSCGKGYQMRHLTCVNVTSQIPASGCPVESKPINHLVCNMPDCRQEKAALSECRDKMDEKTCLSLKHMCHTFFFQAKCCKTCRRNYAKGNHASRILKKIRTQIV